ncbi:DUF1186 domain-containing protein [Luteitalea pratensis]|nr:DUF1186 domain-containing protein [Luteitalea pratensis]
MATLACYGPTPQHATKLVASILLRQGGEVADRQIWTTLVSDVRHDPTVREEVRAFIEAHAVRDTVTASRLLGCPHQEGIDYPMGEECPRCPAWAGIDRWTGQSRVPRQWSASVALAILSTPGHVGRPAAIVAADQYRDAIVEAVLATLARITAHPETATDADSSLITDGLYLCARWRDVRVYVPLVTWFRTAETTDLDLIGDVLTEDAGRMLAAVWGGDRGPLQRLVESPTADEYARAAGLNALALLVAWEEAPRDAVVSYFVRLATEGLERTPGQTWNSLAVECAEIEALEVFPALRAACLEGLIELDYIPAVELDEVEAGQRGVRLQDFRSRHPAIRDVLQEMKWAQPVRVTTHAPNRRSDGSKIGRNEPCPCGSGRKYKKCCGATIEWSTL